VPGKPTFTHGGITVGVGGVRLTALLATGLVQPATIDALTVTVPGVAVPTGV